MGWIFWIAVVTELGIWAVVLWVMAIKAVTAPLPPEAADD